MLLIIKNGDKEIMSMSFTENNKEKIRQTLVENAANLGINDYEIVEEDRPL
jgi:hypothetical protein